MGYTNITIGDVDYIDAKHCTAVVHRDKRPDVVDARHVPNG